VKSGKVTVSTNNTEELEINIENKRIDVEAINKDFLKEMLSAIRQSNKTEKSKEGKKTRFGGIKTVTNTLDAAKDIAEDLRKAGVTVTLSYKGDTVVTLGADASSKILKFATGSKAIEINSPRKLIELGI
jgi:hypothetical protein